MANTLLRLLMSKIVFHWTICINIFNPAFFFFVLFTNNILVNICPSICLCFLWQYILPLYFVCKTTCSSEKYANFNWDELGFGLVETDYMYIMNCPHGESFSQGTVTRYGNFEISPAAGIINYGQVFMQIYIHTHTHNQLNFDK